VTRAYCQRLRRVRAVAALTVAVGAGLATTAAAPASAASGAVALPVVGAPVSQALGGGLGGVGAVGGGGLGGGLSGALGAGASAIPSLPGLILNGLGNAILDGAKGALDQTVKIMGRTTTPQLRSTWFSATYWRMTAIAAVLTLPFLFAAAVQAMLRSDLSLLVRAAFGHLPLAMLAIGVAAPVTMLLLAASDELARAVAAASGGADVNFLGKAATLIGELPLLDPSPFLAVLIGGFTVAGALALWVELLMREAAVYVIVLMLPLAFAALVWPARRVWATRAVELLVALVLAKFAIVAVLSLGGAAMAASVGTGNVQASLAGLVLLVMAAFTPWALMRFVPVAELAAGAVGSLRHEIDRNVGVSADKSMTRAWQAHDATRAAMASMRQDADLTEFPARSLAPPAARDADEGAAGDASQGAAAGEASPEPQREPEVAAGEDNFASTRSTGSVDRESAPRDPATATPAPARPGPAAAAPPEPAPAKPTPPDRRYADAERTTTPDLLPTLARRVNLDHAWVLDGGGAPTWVLDGGGAPGAKPLGPAASEPPAEGDAPAPNLPSEEEGRL
jgi:hypothetical protein